MGIKHAFTSAKDDPADETLVKPSDWNEDHDGYTIAGSAPGSPTDGWLWWDTGTKTLKIWNNSASAWQSVGGGAAASVYAYLNFR